MVTDPYQVRVPAAELSRLAEALAVVDQHAELNHRYRKLIHDANQVLGESDMRLTQARGVAKKLLVLVKASGPDFRTTLTQAETDTLDAGLSQADDLIQQRS